MSSLCFTKLFFLFTSLQATPNDGLPPIVCIKCREQLDSCHRFRRVAHETHQALVGYLQFTSQLNGTPQVSSITIKTFFRVEKLRRKLCFMRKRKTLSTSRRKANDLKSNSLWELCVNFFSNICLFIMQFNCDKSRSKERNRQIHLNMSFDTWARQQPAAERTRHKNY